MTLLRVRAGCDAVGARQVGDTNMKKNREVSGLVTGSEAKVGVAELVAVAGVNNTLFTWTPGHDDEARALTAGIVQTAESSQK